MVRCSLVDYELLTSPGIRLEPHFNKRTTGADKEIAFLDRWFQKYQRLSVPIE